MMTKLNMYAACPDIPSTTIPNLKHNITKSMVGPWPLAPHHDYLQCIYISCIFNALGSKPGTLQFEWRFSLPRSLRALEIFVYRCPPQPIFWKLFYLSTLKRPHQNTRNDPTHSKSSLHNKGNWKIRCITHRYWLTTNLDMGSKLMCQSFIKKLFKPHMQQPHIIFDWSSWALNSKTI